VRRRRAGKRCLGCRAGAYGEGHTQLCRAEHSEHNGLPWTAKFARHHFGSKHDQGDEGTAHQHAAQQPVAENRLLW
jgi:hypothetical protein